VDRARGERRPVGAGHQLDLEVGAVLDVEVLEPENVGPVGVLEDAGVTRARVSGEPDESPGTENTCPASSATGSSAGLPDRVLGPDGSGKAAPGEATVGSGVADFSPPSSWVAIEVEMRPTSRAEREPTPAARSARELDWGLGGMRVSAMPGSTRTIARIVFVGRLQGSKHSSLALPGEPIAGVSGRFELPAKNVLDSSLLRQT
jgi:hypothetical protein